MQKQIINQCACGSKEFISKYMLVTFITDEHNIEKDRIMLPNSFVEKYCANCGTTLNYNHKKMQWE